MNITYSECVSAALINQHAMHMRRMIFSSVTCLAQPHFSRMYHKRRVFLNKVTEHKMWVLIFSTTFTWNVSYSKRTERNVIKIYIYLRVDYPLLKSDFNEARIFSTDSRETSNLMKICPVEADLFPADRWTDEQTDRHDEVNSRFSQFLNPPKDCQTQDKIMN